MISIRFFSINIVQLSISNYLFDQKNSSKNDNMSIIVLYDCFVKNNSFQKTNFRQTQERVGGHGI